MDFRPENALNLAKLGQFDQFFFTISPSMYPQEEKNTYWQQFWRKKAVRQKKRLNFHLKSQNDLKNGHIRPF